MNRYRALLSAGPFRAFFLALLSNNLGNWCVIASLPILVADRFGAGMALVLTLGMRILPKIVLAPVAGVLQRRFGPVRIAGTALLAQAALTLLVPFCPTLWGLELLMAVTGTLDLFTMPSLLALRMPVTPPGLAMEVNTLCSVADRSAKMVGPVIGGFAILAGFVPAFAGFAALNALAAVQVLRLRVAAAERAERDAGSVRDFVRIVRTDRQVLGLMVAGLTYMVMLGGLRPFLFWANRDWFGGLDTAWTGLLSAQGAGALLGAIASALLAQRLMRHMSAFRLSMITGILEGAFHLLLLVVQSSFQAMLVLAAAGIPEIVSTAAWFTALQGRMSGAQQVLFFTFLAPLWDLCYALGIASAGLHAQGVLSLSGYWAIVSLTATLPLLPFLVLRGPGDAGQPRAAAP
ncbi:MAG: MFS transporter [Proteobacteria bacterium]|nr:MFS transporter [Pseudomonadota bacterium]